MGRAGILAMLEPSLRAPGMEPDVASLGGGLGRQGGCETPH